jgi:hypothetical protein
LSHVPGPPIVVSNVQTGDVAKLICKLAVQTIEQSFPSMEHSDQVTQSLHIIYSICMYGEKKRES